MVQRLRFRSLRLQFRSARRFDPPARYGSRCCPCDARSPDCEAEFEYDDRRYRCLLLVPVADPRRARRGLSGLRPEGQPTMSTLTLSQAQTIVTTALAHARGKEFQPLAVLV